MLQVQEEARYIMLVSIKAPIVLSSAATEDALVEAVVLLLIGRQHLGLQEAGFRRSMRHPQKLQPESGCSTKLRLEIQR